MKYLIIIWHTLIAVIYLAIVIAVLSVATTKFETVVLAGIAQLYAAVLHNFSQIDTATAINNLAAFVRFRILAAGHGITESDEGTFEDQENTLIEMLNKSRTQVLIGQVANSAVSLYALFKMIQAVFFT